MEYERPERALHTFVVSTNGDIWRCVLSSYCTMQAVVLPKVEKILKSSLNSISSPSLKIQIMAGKFKSFLTRPSIVLPLHLKQTFPSIIWIFTKSEGDGIESRLPFKIFSTLQELDNASSERIEGGRRDFLVKLRTGEKKLDLKCANNPILPRIMK